jgi:hypothetical protein
MSGNQTDSPVYTFLKPLTPPVRGSADGAIQVAAAEAAAEPANATLAVLMDQVHQAKASKEFLKAKGL